MSKLVGYARVSTIEQELNLQLDALKHAGVEDPCIFQDKISGSKSNRPGLEKALKALEKGDTLIVWRLDRLGRSMPHLVNLIEDLKEKGVGFKSIQDGAIDTTTASGELIFNIFSSLAQFERKLIQERTKAGLKSAKARGVLGGRPKMGEDSEFVQRAKFLYYNQNKPILEIAKILGKSKRTCQRYLAL